MFNKFRDNGFDESKCVSPQLKHRNKRGIANDKCEEVAGVQYHDGPFLLYHSTEFGQYPVYQCFSDFYVDKNHFKGLDKKQNSFPRFCFIRSGVQFINSLIHSANICLAPVVYQFYVLGMQHHARKDIWGCFQETSLKVTFLTSTPSHSDISRTGNPH